MTESTIASVVSDLQKIRTTDARAQRAISDAVGKLVQIEKAPIPTSAAKAEREVRKE